MSAHAAATSKVNILLVDDQPARLLSYETILGRARPEPGHARARAWRRSQRLMEDEFALILLDVSMPGMDGFETAALIHQHPRFEKTPIIFVTGVHVTELDRLKGYKLGAVDYVSIPVVPEILRSKVSVLVELHCQRRELQKLNRSLAEANEQLEQANTTLQAEKTRELEALNRDLQKANAELAAVERGAAGRDRRACARRGGAARSGPPQGRVPGDPRARAAQSAGADPQRGRDHVAHPDRQPAARWSRDVIDRQAMHLTRLVDDLLDISRITRGTIRLAQEPVRSETIVARAVEALQPMIAEHRHELSIDCPDGSLMVRGDLTRLVQVLGNLLNNAAKYTNDGGRIHLSVRRDDRSVEFRVKDNGIGIAPESLSKLFNLFSRLETTDDRTPGGLGIGLALVRKLVEMHAGEVAVHSAGVGQGSEFIVRLPLLDSVPAAARTRSAHGRHDAAASSHPGRRRQSGRARKPGAAARMRRPRSVEGRERRGGVRARREMPAAPRAARHRHAGAGRLRSGAAHPLGNRGART